MKYLPWRVARIAVAVGISLSMILFCLWPVITSENFGKPQGRDIPDALPDEANRVRSDAGFSIVVPEHWEVSSIKLAADREMISAYPRSVIPRRFSATMNARCIGAGRPKDLADYQPVQFQGRPAYEAVTLRPYQDYENPEWFSYTLCFERNGRWYQLDYGIAEERQTLPPEVWRYFHTFRETDQEPAAE